ncbi:MAG: histidine kinase dimerization/phospho-acceptor domain-containing protein, partial [Bacteroidota bacterium]
MRVKIPSSITLSLGIVSLLTLIFVLVLNISQPMASLWLSGLLFFLFGFLTVFATLEWGLFRRLKNQRSQNQREIKKLKEMEAYRREFLGEVSHELKTPIFAVQGFIHTLIDGAMDDEKVRKKFLKKAMKNADRLSN